ncbi:MAG: UbiA prenyltransferase family protein [Muribaculaceae bacterium]|nr:UbiA prenyltransferase family protein [Muribaculaceae bacterium]
MKLRVLLRTIRIEQWIKNVFVLCPILFGGLLFSPSHLVSSLWAFLCFSLAASAVYCYNDIMDLAYDRLHSLKKKRPLASGEISARAVRLIGILLCALALGLTFVADSSGTLCLVIAAYMLLNMFYSLGLKRVPVLDVACIAVGFVLRLVAGSVASGVELSHWIILMTFVLTTLIALAKRRNDVVYYNDTGILLRKNAAAYSLRFIDISLAMLSGAAIVFYMLYSIDTAVVGRLNFPYVYLSGVFVIMGIMRFLMLAVRDNRCDSPTRLVLSDKFLICTILAFVIFFIFVIYFYVP